MSSSSVILLAKAISASASASISSHVFGFCVMCRIHDCKGLIDQSTHDDEINEIIEIITERIKHGINLIIGHRDDPRKGIDEQVCQKLLYIIKHRRGVPIPEVRWVILPCPAGMIKDQKSTGSYLCILPELWQ